MPVYDRHKLVFHHLPKTGGTAFCRWLGDDGTQADGWNGHHQVGQMARRLWDKRIEDGPRYLYTSVAINREPLDRFRSAWHWIKRNGLVGNSFKHLFEDLNVCLLHPDLESLIWHRNALHFRPIEWWYSDNGDRPDQLRWSPFQKPKLVLPDVILDFNNLAAESNRFRDLLGFKTDSDFVASNSSYERGNLSFEAIRRFEAVFARDYSLYNYLKTNLSLEVFKNTNS